MMMLGGLRMLINIIRAQTEEGWSWETQRAGVQYTIDTVIQELAMDPEKKFIQVYLLLAKIFPG